MGKERKLEEYRGINREIQMRRNRSKMTEENREEETRRRIQEDGITGEVYS